jgi:hypothetical protein
LEVNGRVSRRVVRFKFVIELFYVFPEISLDGQGRDAAAEEVPAVAGETAVGAGVDLNPDDMWSLGVDQEIRILAQHLAAADLAYMELAAAHGAYSFNRRPANHGRTILLVAVVELFQTGGGCFQPG